MIGYRSPEYARSLAEFGEPSLLPACGGWILERPIPGDEGRDAMGFYPLFTCADWACLANDLRALGDRLLTLSVVIDPFSPLGEADLRECFDVVRPFKEHFVIDARGFLENQISRHHRYYARKALRDLTVRIEPDPASRLAEWDDLYNTLIRRHGLRGIKAFSRQSFAAQLRVPGLVMFLAHGRSGPVGAHLWIVQDGVAYSHLSAFSETGYEIRAAYALYSVAIATFCETMPDTVRWIDLGAGAGTNSDASDGLTTFKRGWTHQTRTKYFCGRVFDARRYGELTEAAGQVGTSYFPAYRAGEF